MKQLMAVPWLGVVVLVTALLGMQAGWWSPAFAAPATPGATPAATPIATPNADQLRSAGVDELGVIPVIMYHTFTSDPANTTEWTRTFDGLRQQLQQLYDLGFVTISMRDLLSNDIDVPLGKHPIVLTFDDASASQFLIDEHADGSISPRPKSAVGVLEDFFARHPDFGHSALFAVVPNYCFSDSDIDEENSYRTCDAKLNWLADHGYEIANHTLHHTDLSKADADTFAEEVGGTAKWIDEHVSGPANLSRVLVLPYGGRPTPGNWVDSMMTVGFDYEGERIHLEAAVEVAGGPMYSPSSSWFDPFAITRINSDPAVLDTWMREFADGDGLLYTSDGNPDTITVPNPVPDALANEFDRDLIESGGKRLVRYDTDRVAKSRKDRDHPKDKPGDDSGDGLKIGDTARTTDAGVRLREAPGPDAPIVEELPEKEHVTIVGGPETVDGTAWWQVRTADGTVGWVVETFLASAP